MSIKFRFQAQAKEMADAVHEATLIIEACENKRRLTQAEAYDVLCGVVLQYLLRDGKIDKETVVVRLSNFLDQLVGYIEDTTGIVLTEDGDN